MCVIVFAVSKWFDSSLSEVLIPVLHHKSLVLALCKEENKKKRPDWFLVCAHKLI